MAAMATQAMTSIFQSQAGGPGSFSSSSTGSMAGASAAGAQGLSGALAGLGSAPGAAQTAHFDDLVTGAVGQIDKLEATARTTVEGLMSGSGVDIHEAMIATEKADMGFELVLAVRNKALAAYQQVMGMQF